MTCLPGSPTSPTYPLTGGTGSSSPDSEPGLEDPGVLGVRVVGSGVQGAACPTRTPIPSLRRKCP